MNSSSPERVRRRRGCAKAAVGCSWRAPAPGCLILACTRVRRGKVEAMDRTREWDELAKQLSVDSIRSSTAAGSGHPTSSMSAAHLAAVLFANHLRMDVNEPHHPGGDRFILSKGHASPLLYSTLKAIGAITDEQLLTFRTFGSPLEGHPVPRPDMPWVDVGKSVV